MEYRVEQKYLVTETDLAVLRGRLRAVMAPDANQHGDSYEIRSVYFDDLRDSCMEENESGVDWRQKFRIRTYAPALDTYHLEIKEKRRGLTKKVGCALSRDEVFPLMEAALPITPDGRAPMNLLKMRQRMDGMAPKALIIYDRTAFVDPVGNVRITFDRNIRASRRWEDLPEKNVDGCIPVLPRGMQLLEVKYDELLPDHIKGLLELKTLTQTSFSKYYLGRMALQGLFPL